MNLWSSLRSLRRLGLSAVVISCLSAPPVSAATLSVVDLGDDGSAGQLRTLINAASAGDTILIPPGTVGLTGAAEEDANVTGDLDLTKDLTIIGAGPDLTVIDAGGVDRVLHVMGGVTVEVAGVTVRNGSVDPAVGSGGGVLNRGSLTLSNVAVEDNFAGGGGGIAHFDGSLALVGSTVRGNSSTGVTANGGGILSFEPMTIANSTISGNRVFGPSASTLGGGIITADTMIITNSTISGNTTTGNFGGGIYQTPFAIRLTLVNVTITNNRAGVWGGGLSVVGGKVEAVNTIFAGNRIGRGGSARDCAGNLDSLGHNLIQDTTDCTIAGVTTGNILGRRARLRPLADDGGPTETHALRRRSPAVDAGDAAWCPALDQRGETRPLDGDRDGVATCDIGAYELRR